MSGFVFLKFLNLELTILLKLVCMKISPFVWNLFKNKKKKARFFFLSQIQHGAGQLQKCSKENVHIFLFFEYLQVQPGSPGQANLSLCHRECDSFILLSLWEMEGDLQFNYHNYTFRSFHPTLSQSTILVAIASTQ